MPRPPNEAGGRGQEEREIDDAVSLTNPIQFPDDKQAGCCCRAGKVTIYGGPCERRRN